MTKIVTTIFVYLKMKIAFAINRNEVNMKVKQKGQIKKYQLAEIDKSASTVWSEDIWIPDSMIARQRDLQKFVDDIDFRYRATIHTMIQEDADLSRAFPSTDLIQVMDYDEYYASEDGHVGLYRHRGCWYLYMGDALDGLALMDAKDCGITLSGEQIRYGLECSKDAMAYTIRNFFYFEA